MQLNSRLCFAGLLVFLVVALSHDSEAFFSSKKNKGCNTNYGSGGNYGGGYGNRNPGYGFKQPAVDQKAEKKRRCVSNCRDEFNACQRKCANKLMFKGRCKKKCGKKSNKCNKKCKPSLLRRIFG